MTPERLRELAEAAISYLNDSGLIEDFMEDRDISFSEEEEKYFELEFCEYDCDDNWIDQDY